MQPYIPTGMNSNYNWCGELFRVNIVIRDVLVSSWCVPELNVGAAQGWPIMIKLQNLKNYLPFFFLFELSKATVVAWSESVKPKGKLGKLEVCSENNWANTRWKIVPTIILAIECTVIDKIILAQENWNSFVCSFTNLTQKRSLYTTSAPFLYESLNYEGYHSSFFSLTISSLQHVLAQSVFRVTGALTDWKILGWKKYKKTIGRDKRSNKISMWLDQFKFDMLNWFNNLIEFYRSMFLSQFNFQVCLKIWNPPVKVTLYALRLNCL